MCIRDRINSLIILYKNTARPIFRKFHGEVSIAESFVIHETCCPLILLESLNFEIATAKQKQVLSSRNKSEWPLLTSAFLKIIPNFPGMQNFFLPNYYNSLRFSDISGGPSNS